MQQVEEDGEAEVGVKEEEKKQALVVAEPETEEKEEQQSLVMAEAGKKEEEEVNKALVVAN